MGGRTEIDRIYSEARLAEAEANLRRSIANALDRTPWMLKHNMMDDERLQWEIDNCIQHECYVGANYLTQILEKRK